MSKNITSTHRGPLIICAICLALVCIIGVISYHRRTSLLVYVPYNHTGGSPIKNDTLRIAFIGDSWAERSVQYDMCGRLDTLLSRAGIISHSIALGHGGLKSKDICSLIYDETSDMHQLLDTHPDYALISYGINDQHGAYGPQYYVHHTYLITERLAEMGIVPILIELPQWDITEQYYLYSWSKRATYEMMHRINAGTTAAESHKMYIKAIEAYNIGEHTLLLHDEEVWKESDCWTDKMHLNSKGYQILAELAYRIIKEDITSL